MIDFLTPVSKLLDKFIPDADKRQELAHDIATMAERHAQERVLAQLEVNKAEAESGSAFRGGWRPFIGWTCGSAFAYTYVVQPIAIFVLTVCGVDVPEFPVLDMGSLTPVMIGMLGLGGLRTVEKLKGKG